MDMGKTMKELKLQDREVWQAICQEEERQRSTIELIASENFTSPAVRQAAGSCLTHKYAEGYPGKRYYGGCANVDLVEDLARERAKALFGAQYANVQPHSGSQANMAVYSGRLQAGDTILSMDLSHGGHLSHGSKVNFSGRIFNCVFYGVDQETQYIDYDQVEALAMEHRPKLIIAGASTYPRFIDYKRFREIADQSGAKLMVDMAHIAGLVAAECHPSPVGQAHFVTSTTHKSLRGPRGGFILTDAEFGTLLDANIFPGIQGGPLMHIIAAKAVAFAEAMTEDFHEYQQQVVKNARVMAQGLLDAGFKLITGGTDNHMMLVDITNKGLTGKEAEEILDRIGITANKNAIPFETRPPTITSGIRFGTPIITTRGMLENDVLQIVEWIDAGIKFRDNETELITLQRKITAFARSFPLFKPSPVRMLALENF